ncbi:MBL fold metallo-hydrolase [Sagittula salina]|uniref:MBL fold metallo-hydrolase n=1 Tax=Sagittula salina TaxID=2820268 RepID=A0A940MNM9_9RHOB|nr:MBL fold metallo-hydrolase [Sagittula salina]MBP0482092.1 MBL fold metallo-hydrolase [Sagittula salina]
MQDPQPEFQPQVGVAEVLEPGLRRVLAPNASPMTFRGTNTYLLGDGKDVAVIDPGPLDASHLDAILAALGPGQQVSHVLVTHSHLDHSPLASVLAARTGARVHGFGASETGRSTLMQVLAQTADLGGGEGVDQKFSPDVALSDGEQVGGDGWQLVVHHTPGHMANHLAFAWGDVLFSGDLVMGWATSLVSPPDGDLTAFMGSLRHLRGRGWRRFHAGHGAPVEEPEARLTELLAHREGREASILTALGDGPSDAQALAERIYTGTPPALMGAAARNVLAHLIDLTARNLVAPCGELSAEAIFQRSGEG